MKKVLLKTKITFLCGIILILSHKFKTLFSFLFFSIELYGEIIKLHAFTVGAVQKRNFQLDNISLVVISNVHTKEMYHDQQSMYLLAS